MAHTIEQIATALGAKAEGRLDLTFSRISEPADADKDALALAMAPKYAEDLPKGGARAAVLWEGADWQAMGLEAAIFAPRPSSVHSSAWFMFLVGSAWWPLAQVP